MDIKTVLHCLQVLSLVAIATAAPPYSLYFGEHIDPFEDLEDIATSESQGSFVQLSNNPRVSIIQAPISQSFVSQDENVLDGIIHNPNLKVIQASPSVPEIHSSISTSSSVVSTKSSSASQKKVNKGEPSIFPSSTQMFPKSKPTTPTTVKIRTKNVNIPASSLAQNDANSNLVELAESFTPTKTSSPAVTENKEDVISRNSGGIQVFSLGTADEVDENLRKIKLLVQENAQRKKHPTTLKSYHQLFGDSKPASTFSNHQNVIPVQGTDLGSLSDTEKRITVEEYLLSLNGKHGITVLPMSSILNGRNPAASKIIRPRSPKPKPANPQNDLIKQLAQYAIQEGLVDDLKKDFGVGQNQRKDKPIDTTTLTKLLAQYQAQNGAQDFSTAIQSSNIHTRNTDDNKQVLEPELFKKTLTDLFFVKGQWLGTFLGGMIDIGTVITDAFKQILSGSTKSKT